MKCIFIQSNIYEDRLECKYCKTQLPIKFKDRDIVATCTGQKENEKPMKKSTLLQKLKSYTKAVVKHVASGESFLPAEKIQERLNICLQCPKFKQFEDNKNGEVRGICQITHGGCGCHLTNKNSMKFFNKLAFPKESCPDNPPKWGPVANNVNQPSE